MQLVTEENIAGLAAARWGTAHDPRLAEIMQALVRHLHDFAREVWLTEPEWMAAMQWLIHTGQISDEKREELILASDVLGLSMLVVQTNHRLDPGATPATVLGPFHIEGSALEFGADMADGVPDEAQLDVDEARLRGKYTSRPDGTYCVRTIAPLGYSIPMDGPVGELISQTDISHYRPAHIHFLLDVPGYEPLITHLFQQGAQYLDSDVVFGTKVELVVGSSAASRVPPPTAACRDSRGCWRATTSGCSRRREGRRPDRPVPRTARPERRARRARSPLSPTDRQGRPRDRADGRLKSPEHVMAP